MIRQVWRNPNPPYQTYITTVPKDHNVPVGYVQVGTDGSFDRPVQNYQPGGASGGWPAYPTPMAGETVKQMLMRINGSDPGGVGY
jgi:hypothetical protein